MPTHRNYHFLCARKLKNMKTKVLSLLIAILLTAGIKAQTAGELSVTVTTSAAGGGYAPRHIVAIWVETEQGNFVKTLMAYAANRRTHLNIWEQSTTAAGIPFNVVDAITGSTRNSHDTRNCMWNGLDINGSLMPDGNYRLRMELTDKNSTGNYSTFNFTKNDESYILSPANVPSFAGISIEWEPVVTGIDNAMESSLRIIPNPGNSKVTIEGVNIEKITLYTPNGQLLMETNQDNFDVSQLNQGVYVLSIQTENGMLIRKRFIKN